MMTKEIIEMAMSVGIMKRNLRIMSRHMLPESISLAAYGQSSPRSIRRISDPAEGNSAADHFARLTETPTVPCEESSRWRSRVGFEASNHTHEPRGRAQLVMRSAHKSPWRQLTRV